MLGLGTIAKKVFGTPNDRKVKATKPVIDKINALEPEFKALSDEQIKAKTDEALAQIEDKTLIEGCVFKCATDAPNHIWRRQCSVPCPGRDGACQTLARRQVKT